MGPVHRPRVRAARQSRDALGVWGGGHGAAADAEWGSDIEEGEWRGEGRGVTSVMGVKWEDLLFFLMFCCWFFCIARGHFSFCCHLDTTSTTTTIITPS